ncbi:MAG: transposase [Alphaproteobacteria bacterium]|nr:transposase [Alphaproteobacteria bacterium]
MSQYQIYKGESRRKLQGEFQKLRKRYCGQHLWMRGYFFATSGQISAKEVEK